MRVAIQLLNLCLLIALAVGSVQVVAVAQSDEETMRALVNSARAAQSRGDFAMAAESYRKATELEPSIPELWANLGLMYHQTGKHAEAVESLKKASQLNGSLFAPQLFLGIEYLQLRKPASALTYLETAARLNPNDLQAALALGSAYDELNRADSAAHAYLRATQIAPNSGAAWLELGTALLQQIENDARLMTTSYGNSPYTKLRAAETYLEEDKLTPAENAFKAAVASAAPAPCANAELGIALLREAQPIEARARFEIETRSGSQCGLARLGTAIADLAQGHTNDALNQLTSIAAADRGFVLSNLPLFRGAVSREQVKALAALCRAQCDGNTSADIGILAEQALLTSDAPTPASFQGEDSAPTSPQTSGQTAEQLYESGQFAQCSEALRPSMESLPVPQQQLLAMCSFLTGDFETASRAAEYLKRNPAAAAQGLYWESRADQKLAIAALARAGEIDPESPRLHVLTGNSYRQQRRWSDAEAEYRKAVALDPKNRIARLSLAIALFTELKMDEAFDLDQSLLAESADDSEANLLAAEILVQEHRFLDAEPYLSKCHNLKPELAPRVHVLLGQAYAQTGRTRDAIAEYRLGMAGDEDGSLHYQLARLYQKSGDNSKAEQQIRLSKQIREKWDNQAHLDMGQPLAETSEQ